MQEGYSRTRRAHVLPMIRRKQSSIRQKLLQQQTLINQVKRLDEIIKADSNSQINGFIFTAQMKDRIAEDLLNCINKEHSLISYGFEIWKEMVSSEGKFQKTNLIAKQPTFKEKLHDLSIKNVQEYEKEKMKQLSRIKQTRWILNYQREKSLSNVSKLSQMLNRQCITTSNTPKRIDFVQNGNVSRKKIYTEITEDPGTHVVPLQRLEKMLNAVRPNAVTIWLPPKSYPQFYGIFVASTSKNPPFRCRIKKYIFFRQGLNRRFFQSLIDYVSSTSRIEIDSLEMIVNKTEYNQYFQPFGWKMKSWQGVQKILAVYSRTPNKFQ